MGYSYLYQGLSIVSNEKMSDDALDAYANWGWRHYGTSLEHMMLTFNGGMVKIECTISARTKHEISRIKGYIAKVV